MKTELLRAELLTDESVKAFYKCEKGEFSLEWSYAHPAGGMYDTSVGMDWVSGTIESDNEELQEFVERELVAGEAECNDYAFYISIIESRTDIQFNSDLTASENFLDSLSVSDVQVFKYDYGFSANFALNDKLLIQLGTDGDWYIPESCEQYWNHKGCQDLFCAASIAEEIVEKMELPEELEEIKEQYTPDFY